MKEFVEFIRDNPSADFRVQYFPDRKVIEVRCREGIKITGNNIAVPRDTSADRYLILALTETVSKASPSYRAAIAKLQDAGPPGS